MESLPGTPYLPPALLHQAHSHHDSAVFGGTAPKPYVCEFGHLHYHLLATDKLHVILTQLTAAVAVLSRKVNGWAQVQLLQPKRVEAACLCPAPMHGAAAAVG